MRNPAQKIRIEYLYPGFGYRVESLVRLRVMVEHNEEETYMMIFDTIAACTEYQKILYGMGLGLYEIEEEQRVDLVRAFLHDNPYSMPYRLRKVRYSCN